MGPTLDPHFTFPTSGALGKYLRVVLSAGVLALAASTDYELGCTAVDVFSVDTAAAVRLRNSPGRDIMVANGAITSGNPVYAAAGGKVGSSGTIIIGTAVSTTATDGDHIYVVRTGPNVTFGDTGTNQSIFTVDADSTGAIVAIDTNSATGNFTLSISPPNLTGNIRITLPAATGTLATLAGTETLSNKTFTAPVIGAATGTSLTVTAGLKSSGPTGAGIGYATGAGGAVSQATDRTTGVTLNTLTGAITTQATSLAAAAEVSFTVTNSTVAIGDVVIASIRSGPTVGCNTFVTVTAVAAGSFQLTLNNPHASTADTGAAIINFAVIKAVSA